MNKPCLTNTSCVCGSTASNLIPTQTTVTPGMGLLPFLPNQHVAGQTGPGPGNTQDKQPAVVGLAEGSLSGSQAYLQNFPNLTAGGLLMGHHKQQQSQTKSTEVSSGVRKLCVRVCERECVSVCACIHMHIYMHT